MAVRFWWSFAAAAVFVAACGATPTSAPTPPPGMGVSPRAAFVDTRNADSRKKWQQISPGVFSLVLASTSKAIVDVVEYAKSSVVTDPYADNFRYVIDGTGYCDVGKTRVRVQPRDLVVTPMGDSRTCSAAKGTLTMLTASLPRGRGAGGAYDPAPQAGLIDVGRILRSMPTSAAQTLFNSFAAGQISVMKVIRVHSALVGLDQFYLVVGGSGVVSMNGRQRDALPGLLIVAPSGVDTSFRSTGLPLEVLAIRTRYAMNE